MSFSCCEALAIYDFTMVALFWAGSKHLHFVKLLLFQALVGGKLCKILRDFHVHNMLLKSEGQTLHSMTGSTILRTLSKSKTHWVDLNIILNWPAAMKLSEFDWNNGDRSIWPTISSSKFLYSKAFLLASCRGPLGTYIILLLLFSGQMCPRITARQCACIIRIRQVVPCYTHCIKMLLVSTEKMINTLFIWLFNWKKVILREN